MDCLIRVRRLVLLGLVVACNVDDPEADSGSGDGGQTSGVAGSGGEEVGSAESGGEEAPMCPEFANTDEQGQEATFVVRNDSAEPIWVRPVTCGSIAPVRLLDGEGTALGFHGSNCHPHSCEDHMTTDDCSVGACDDCTAASLGRLDPGGETEVHFGGLVETQVELPSECAMADNCATSCALRDVATPGPYTLELEIYRACNGDCECGEEPATDTGYCLLFTQADITQSETLTVDFMHPEDTTVEVVID